MKIINHLINVFSFLFLLMVLFFVKLFDYVEIRVYRMVFGEGPNDLFEWAMSLLLIVSLSSIFII